MNMFGNRGFNQSGGISLERAEGVPKILPGFIFPASSNSGGNSETMFGAQSQGTSSSESHVGIGFYCTPQDPKNQPRNVFHPIPAFRKPPGTAFEAPSLDTKLFGDRGSNQQGGISFGRTKRQQHFFSPEASSGNPGTMLEANNAQRANPGLAGSCGHDQREFSTQDPNRSLFGLNPAFRENTGPTAGFNAQGARPGAGMPAFGASQLGSSPNNNTHYFLSTAQDQNRSMFDPNPASRRNPGTTDGFNAQGTRPGADLADFGDTPNNQAGFSFGAASAYGGNPGTTIGFDAEEDSQDAGLYCSCERGQEGLGFISKVQHPNSQPRSLFSPNPAFRENPGKLTGFIAQGVRPGCDLAGFGFAHSASSPNNQKGPSFSAASASGGNPGRTFSVKEKEAKPETDPKRKMFRMTVTEIELPDDVGEVNIGINGRETRAGGSGSPNRQKSSPTEKPYNRQTVISFKPRQSPQYGTGEPAKRSPGKMSSAKQSTQFVHPDDQHPGRTLGDLHRQSPRQQSSQFVHPHDQHPGRALGVRYRAPSVILSNSGASEIAWPSVRQPSFPSNYMFDVFGENSSAWDCPPQQRMSPFASWWKSFCC